MESVVNAEIKSQKDILTEVEKTQVNEFRKEVAQGSQSEKNFEEVEGAIQVSFLEIQILTEVNKTEKVVAESNIVTESVNFDFNQSGPDDMTDAYNEVEIIIEERNQTESNVETVAEFKDEIADKISQLEAAIDKDFREHLSTQSEIDSSHKVEESENITEVQEDAEVIAKSESNVDVCESESEILTQNITTTDQLSENKHETDVEVVVKEITQNDQSEQEIIFISEEKIEAEKFNHFVDEIEKEILEIVLLKVAEELPSENQINDEVKETDIKENTNEESPNIDKISELDKQEVTRSSSEESTSSLEIESEKTSTQNEEQIIEAVLVQKEETTPAESEFVINLRKEFDELRKHVEELVAYQRYHFQPVVNKKKKKPLAKSNPNRKN